MESDVVKDLLSSIIHPYSRYGLAVALYRERPRLNELEEAGLSRLLVEAIQTGLGYFRMTTVDKPGVADVLRYKQVKFQELKDNPHLVQSSGLAAQGTYLYPTIVTTDGDAKGTFDNALRIVDDLQASKKLDSSFELSRSFAPTTAKINNGGLLKPPRSSLLEAACSLITTLTPIKPAAWINGRNTITIPDLPDVADHEPLCNLCDFVELFNRMMTSDLDNLMQANINGKSAPQAALQPSRSTSKKPETGTAKSEYKRPLMHNGNYPYAPRDASAFGAVGLLAAIGRWKLRALETPWANSADGVLAALENRPLYIISYDRIEHAQFGHHAVELARKGELSNIVSALMSKTLVGADEIESGRQSRDAPIRRLFYVMTNRFLQSFSPASFQDFLAFRTEYPADVKPLFEEYFMQTHDVSPELISIVHGADVYGRWLNRTAYLAAKAEVETKTNEKEKGFWDKVRKEKAKIITILESAAMNAKSSTAMIAQVSTQAGRLLQGDAPENVRPFVEAVTTGRIEFNDARQLLMAYLRIQSPIERKGKPTNTDANITLSKVTANLDDSQEIGDGYGN